MTDASPLGVKYGKSMLKICKPSSRYGFFRRTAAKSEGCSRLLKENEAVLKEKELQIAACIAQIAQVQHASSVPSSQGERPGNGALDALQLRDVPGWLKLELYQTTLRCLEEQKGAILQTIQALTGPLVLRVRIRPEVQLQKNEAQRRRRKSQKNPAKEY